MMLKLLYCAAATFFLAAGVHANPIKKGDLVTFPTRAGVTQSIYVESPTASPQWVVVLFSGGEGHLGLTSNGATNQGNFVIRSASHWIDWGVGVAYVDTPSDHAEGISFGDRMSEQSFVDTKAVVRNLRERFPNSKIALIGTSAGTLSVGNALERDPALADAFVLTSSVTVATRGNSTTISGVDVDGAKARVLMVSNKGDMCPLTLLYGSSALAEKNHYDFLQVDSEESKGGRCKPWSPHGFLGIEVPVLTSIRDWLTTGHLPN